MKVRDSQTTRAMLYVALGAVALAIVEALPSDLYAHAPATPREVVRIAHESPMPAPVELTNDSFSSPILARHISGGLALGGQPALRSSEPLSPLQGMPLPNVGPARPFQERNVSSQAPEIGNSDRQQEREPKRTILLTGIVQAGDLEALIAVDGKDCLPCRVGEQLGPGIKLLAIKDSKAVIGLGHQRKVIYLGQVTEL